MTKPDDKRMRFASAFRARVGSDQPHTLGGRWAQRHVAAGSRKSEGLVVVALVEANLGPRADAAGFEKLEQAAVAFIDAAHGIGLPRRGVGQQNQAAAAATGRAFEFAEIAVRASDATTQAGQKLRFE